MCILLRSRKQQLVLFLQVNILFLALFSSFAYGADLQAKTLKKKEARIAQNSQLSDINEESIFNRRAYAEGNNQLNTDRNNGNSRLKLSFDKKKYAVMTSEIKLLSDNFISPEFEAANQKSFQFLQADINSTKTDHLFQMDVTGAYALGEPLLSYIDATEAYFNFDFEQNHSLFVGRKKIMWNELDARWNFSVWEPVFRWNPLLPHRQGLTGLFWHKQEGRTGFTLFGSFFYLPDQGPSFSIDQNGEFEKANPWFQRPPDSIQVNSRVTKTEYKFEYPEESKVILQKSYAAKIDYQLSDDTSFQVAHSYKPMNQLALGYDGQLDIPKDRVAVTIHPEVYYHRITSGDLIYKFDRVKMGLSGIWEEPLLENRFDNRWTYPEFSSAVIWSPFFDWKLADHWIWSTQYLKVNGGEVEEKGPLASPNGSTITHRFSFQEAYQFALSWQQRFNSRNSLRARFSYTTSERNQFDIVRMDWSWNWMKSWRVFNEWQLVKANSTEPDSYTDILPFSNHDRVRLGVGYAF